MKLQKITSAFILILFGCNLKVSNQEQNSKFSATILEVENLCGRWELDSVSDGKSKIHIIPFAISFSNEGRFCIDEVLSPETNCNFNSVDSFNVINDTLYDYTISKHYLNYRPAKRNPRLILKLTNNLLVYKDRQYGNIFYFHKKLN